MAAPYAVRHQHQPNALLVFAGDVDGIIHRTLTEIDRKIKLVLEGDPLNPLDSSKTAQCAVLPECRRTESMKAAINVIGAGRWSRAVSVSSAAIDCLRYLLHSEFHRHKPRGR